MLKSTLEKNLKIAEDRIKVLEAKLAAAPKAAQPLRGVRTNLNDAPAYIITLGDYKRLGGE